MYIGYIYKFTLIPTGKFYVGKHSKPSFDKSYYGSGIAWKSAISKYSKKDILREILEWVDESADLNAREEYWIHKLDACNPEIAYNIDPMCVGLYHHTDETKEKISASGKLKRWMYKDDQRTFANPERVDKLLSEGWKFGRGPHLDKSFYRTEDRKNQISAENSGRIFYTNFQENVKIKPIQIAEYEAKGYIKGFSRNGQLVSPHAITNGKTDRYIQNSYLDIMLSRGWVEGSKDDFCLEECEFIYANFLALKQLKHQIGNAKISAALKDKETSLETRIKISETLRGQPMSDADKLEFIEKLEFRKLSKDERRVKSLEKHRKICSSIEHKKKLSAAHLGLQKGSIWINNGVVNKRVMPVDFEEIYSHRGFKKGRLKNADK